MWCLLAGVLTLASLSAACTPSITTVSGTHAPVTVCSGAMIFADDFNELDTEKWQHENTLAGGGVSIIYIGISYPIMNIFDTIVTRKKILLYLHS